jgi:hypothetical protein
MRENLPKEREVHAEFNHGWTPINTDFSREEALKIFK